MDPQEIARISTGMAYEAGRAAPPPDFPSLPDIPGKRYVDASFYELEQRHLWRKTWLYGIHDDEVPLPGSYVRWNRAGEPLFFLRGDDEKVRCFYITCRHRGAPVVSEDRGQLDGTFACPYHGWTYDRRGDLVGLRDRSDFVGLDMSCRSLVEVRCEALGGWYFINLDPDAEPLADSIRPIWNHFSAFQLDRLRLVDKQAFTLRCNVKVLLDAFLEVYHLKSIHGKTVDLFLDHRGAHITLWRGGHSRMVTPNRRDGWIDPAVAGLPELPGVDPIYATSNISLNLYPNLVTPVAPSGIPFLCFWPVDLTTMMIEVHWFAPGWSGDTRPPIWDQRLTNFRNILDEDLQFAEKIQKSVESSGFRGMPLNYQERRIYHWHQELDRRIGAANIDEDARVLPVLDSYVEEYPPAIAASPAKPSSASAAAG
jgi:phenylpropionate dioxygenase-like ring-hydroxylating dioxygenase large terminal subunit